MCLVSGHDSDTGAPICSFAFAVDEDKIKEEARYDGKWVLTTNMDLPSREVALKYKRLVWGICG
jgi:hypothetical protein